MPPPRDPEEIMAELETALGGAGDAREYVRRRAMLRNTIASRRALDGVASMTVNDWDTLEAFLAAPSANPEAQAYPDICTEIKRVIAERDPDGELIKLLLLAYRTTRAT